MKAKEYAKQFNASFEKANTEDEIFKVVSDFFIQFMAETQEIANRYTTDLSLFHVLDQSQQKWAAIARQSNGVLKESGYLNYMKENMPEIYFPWQEYKKRTKRR